MIEELHNPAEAPFLTYDPPLAFENSLFFFHPKSRCTNSGKPDHLKILIVQCLTRSPALVCTAHNNQLSLQHARFKVIIYFIRTTHRAAQRSVTLGHSQRKRTSGLTEYIGCCYANKAAEGAKWDGAHPAMGEPHLLSVRQLCAPHRAFAALL